MSIKAVLLDERFLSLALSEFCNTCNPLTALLRWDKLSSDC